MDITGTIEKILPTQTGTSAAGKEWKKLSFTLRTTEEYNNFYCFDVFGDEKVDNFLKYNKEGQQVKVDFNVKCNEWKDKYFVSLDAWKIFKAESANLPDPKDEAPDSDNLPF